MTSAALLDTPELAPLWRACRRRMESNGLTLAGGVLSLRELSAAQLDAVAGLLGRRRPLDGVIRVRLADVDRALRTSAVGAGLTDVLAAIEGPLTDRRATRARRLDARDHLYAVLGAHPVLAGAPELESWLTSVRSNGLARRLAGDAEGEVLRLALDALAAIHGANGAVVRLAVLAAQVTGDAHGLDRGQAVGTLCTHALARLDGSRTPREAGEWRRTWDRAGVACDDLSCDVLALDLPGWGSGPLRLMLRQVVDWQPPEAMGLTVFVCENPAVVAAAADERTDPGAPIVCLEGMPSTAARVVLRALVGAGALVVYHGDFDWWGLRIARTVARAVPSAPWRYGPADYRRALEAGLGTIALAGNPVDSPWDPELASVMSARGVAIYEEQVMPSLLDDLAGRSAASD